MSRSSSEGDDHRRDPGRGGRLQEVDAGDGIDRRLDDPGDAGIDDVGIGPGQHRGHRDDRKLDRRVAIHPDPAERDPAEEHDAHAPP